MVGDLGAANLAGHNSMFAASDAADSGFGEDPLYEQAKKTVIEARKASASVLQRRLRVGYARAARLMDILEERGVVGAGDGAKPRDVLVSGDSGDVAQSAPEQTAAAKVVAVGKKFNNYFRKK